MLIDIAIAIVVLVAGTGSAGIGVAWLNDKREAARARKFPQHEPKRVLDARFAAGEIDEAEYGRRMHVLLYGPPLELDSPRLGLDAPRSELGAD